VGQEATFTVDALPGVTFHALVGQVRENPLNVQNVITYDAVLRVANPGIRLLPGMTANTRLLTAEHDGVLKIPSAALRYLPRGAPRDPKAQSVYVLDASGKPVRQTVTTGITEGSFVELVSGDLKEGDAVIVSETRRAK
jgi:HlyD family secretion protein